MAPGGIRSGGSRTVTGSQQVVGSQQVASSQPNSSSRLVASSQATAGSQPISGSRVVAGSPLVASSPRMDESLSRRLCSTNEVVAGGGRPSCGSQYFTGNQIVCASYSKESNMGSTGESRKKKNVRKTAQNKALKNFIDSGGGKPKIEIPIGKLRPLGKWAKEWVTEMGIIVRQNIPLTLHYWKDVTSELKTTLYDKVLAKFDVDISLEHVQEAVDDSLKDRFKARRHNLHLYYLSLGDEVDKHDHPESSITQDEWEALCAHFESEDFKKRSEINRRNKKDLRVNHRGGCKSFVRHRFDQRDPETGEEPDRVFYRNMRWNSKKGWIADEAEQNYEKMVEILSQPVEEGAKQLTDGEIVEKVLGKRSGYAIGHGRAEVPPSRKTYEVNQLRMKTEEQDRELNELCAWKAYQEELRNAQQQKINAQAKNIDAQAKKQEEIDQILNALMQKMAGILSQPVEEGAKQLTDEEIVEKVVGKRSGYVIGLGRAEVPPSRKAKVIYNDEVNQLSMTEEQDRELNELRAWKASQEELRNAQQQKINAQAKNIDAQAKKQEEIDQILNALKQKMVGILSQPVEEGAKQLTDGEIVEKVVGKRSGYVIGLARAEVPPSRKAKVIYNDEVNQLSMRTVEQDRELNELRAWKASQEELRNAQQHKINAQAKNIDAQAKKQEEIDQSLNALKQKLGL